VHGLATSTLGGPSELHPWFDSGCRISFRRSKYLVNY
jgi:hypothetical protein